MNRLLSSTLCCLLLCSPLFASEDLYQPVGERACQNEEFCQEGEYEVSDLTFESPKMAFVHAFPADYAHYQGYDHWAVFFSNDCRVIQLEDESQWMCIPEDIYKTLSWQTGDLISIHSNMAWFPRGQWALFNRRTQETVQVDLIRSALLSSPYAKFVSGIDAYHGVIYLTDGTRWVVNGSDMTRLMHWFVSDMVIIGMNDSFWSSRPYPAMLINVALNQCVYAKLQ